MVAIGLSAASLMAWADPAPPQEPSIPAEIPVTPMEIQSAATTIARSFAHAVAAAGGPSSAPPAVAVFNTPNLAYYNHRTDEIVLPYWQGLEEPQRGFFLALAEDEETAGRLFTELFDWFLVAHEMTHWFQREIGLDLDRFASEAIANDLAVAYFMDSDDELRLVELEGLLEVGLQRLSDPTPPGQDPAAFFDANYRELAVDPSRYGYYQFRFILDAIARRAQLDFVVEIAVRMSQ